MKQLPIKALILTMVLWTGCNHDILEIQAPLPQEESYYTNEGQFNGAVIGIYSKLVFFYNYRAYDNQGNRYLHDMRLMPDDDITTSNQTGYEIFSTITPQDQKIQDYFKILYQLNQRANVFLRNHELKADAAYRGSEFQDIHKGEALFLRGFGHFMLWNLFGVAPVINTQISTVEEAKVSNSPDPDQNRTALLDAAIADFEEAALLLPADHDFWGAEQRGRVTRASALGMAAKALVFRGTVEPTQRLVDMQAALAHIDDLEAIPGVALNPAFNDNFELTKENSQESLFEVQLGPNTNNPEQSNPWLSTDRFAGNGDISNFLGYFDGHWSASTGNMVATTAIRNAFDPNDGRLPFTMEADGKINKYVKDATPGKGEGFFEVAYHHNARVLRYADVKLLKAEALVQSGGDLGDAIDEINDIRTRAGGIALRPTDETDPDVVMEWVIDERRFELAFEEGHRWYDLRRWHLGGVLDDVYGQNLLDNWNFASLTAAPAFAFEEKNLWYPIPFNEIALNTNLKQNTKW